MFNKNTKLGNSVFCCNCGITLDYMRVHWNYISSSHYSVFGLLTLNVFALNMASAADMR